MKKNYIQPMIEVTEIESNGVVMTSLSFGDDITTGTTPADAPALQNWDFFAE